MQRVFVAAGARVSPSQLRTNTQAVQPAVANDGDHFFRYEKIERSAIGDATTQIGTRHLESRNLDVSPFEISGQRDGRPRTIHDDEMRHRCNLIDALPCVDVGCRVVTHDGEQSRTRMFDLEKRKRVGGVADAAAIDFFGTGLEAVNALDSGPHHGQAICGRRHGSGARLLPGVVGDHQEDDIKCQRVADIDRRHQMPEMGRVERPPKKTNSQRHKTGFYERPHPENLCCLVKPAPEGRRQIFVIFPVTDPPWVGYSRYSPKNRELRRADPPIPPSTLLPPLAPRLRLLVALPSPAHNLD